MIEKNPSLCLLTSELSFAAELFYWRTKSGSEVNFILYGANVFVALEVKRSRNVHHTDLRALKTFQEDYPEATIALLYMGHEALKIGDVLCLPCDKFLRQLHPEGDIFPPNVDARQLRPDEQVLG